MLLSSSCIGWNFEVHENSNTNAQKKSRKIRIIGCMSTTTSPAAKNYPDTPHRATTLCSNRLLVLEEGYDVLRSDEFMARGAREMQPADAAYLSSQFPITQRCMKLNVKCSDIETLMCQVLINNCRLYR